MPEFSLFEAEERVIREATEFLLDRPEANSPVDAFGQLLRHYKRLFREMKQLIRMSDRRERELSELNNRLTRLSSALEYQATHDAMTGVLNKGTITRIIQNTLSEAGFVLLILDIDHFKKINDTYGHLSGDLLLRGVASLIRESIKDRDSLGRFGGEEFIVVLRDVDPSQACLVADALRSTLAEARFNCAGQELSITASLGVTLCRRGEAFEAVYVRADEAMYAAKRAGRNRVACAERHLCAAGTPRIGCPSGVEHGPTGAFMVPASAGRLFSYKGARAGNRVSERKRLEQLMRLHFEQSPLAFIEWCPDLTVREWNPAAERIFGWMRDEAIGRPVDLLVPADQREQVSRIANVLLAGAEGTRTVHEAVTRSGDRIWCEWYSIPLFDDLGRAAGILCLSQDITERRQTREQLDYLAYYDPLTGLPNRTLLEDRISRSMIEAQRHGMLVAVIFLGIDRFKAVNDTMGHDAGDALLKAAAGRLQRCVREGDTVARLGGDEYAIVLSDMGAEQDAALVAQKILDAFVRPFDVAGNEVFITVSMGIALYPIDHGELKGLLKNADSAMHHAKEAGGNAYRFYSPDMTAKAHDRFVLETHLRQGLERGELLLHYQPQVSLEDGSIVGVEALLRWQHPSLGLVSPGKFIPIAEETGLIVPIGEWVLRTACSQVQAWSGSGLPSIRLAVNVSSRQFRDGALARTVLAVLAETGFDARRLELEITESLLIESDARVCDTLMELKDAGVSISIDDFGTGYSSLSYLKRFPIDCIKIDRSFVRDIASTPNDASLVKAIIAMARSLRLKVIAEGVESGDQIEYLMAEGCHEVQGYYFGKPMEGGCMAALLGEWRASVSEGTRAVEGRIGQEAGEWLQRHSG